MPKYIQPKPNKIASTAFAELFYSWFFTLIIMLAAIGPAFAFLVLKDPPQWLALIGIIPASICCLLILHYTCEKTLDYIKYGSTPFHMSLCPATLGESFQGWFLLPGIKELESVKVVLVCKENEVPGKKRAGSGRNYWSSEKYFKVSHQDNQCFLNVEFSVPDNLPSTGFDRNNLENYFHYTWELKLHVFLVGVISLDRTYIVPVQQKQAEKEPAISHWEKWPVYGLVGKQLIPAAVLLFIGWDYWVILFMYWAETFILYLIITTLSGIKVIIYATNQWHSIEYGKIRVIFKSLLKSISFFAVFSFFYFVWGGFLGVEISAYMLSVLYAKTYSLTLYPADLVYIVLEVVRSHQLILAIICLMLVYGMEMIGYCERELKQQPLIPHKIFFWWDAITHMRDIYFLSLAILVVILIIGAYGGGAIIELFPSTNILFLVIIICLKACSDAFQFERKKLKETKPLLMFTARE